MPVSHLWLSGRLLLASLFASTFLACVIEQGPQRRSDYEPGPEPAPSPGRASEAPVPALSSSMPMRAVMDTGQVMNAEPGLGVGIFAEYGSGGQWHLWWTCDTAQSGQDCDVVLRASVSVGTLSNVVGEGLSASEVTFPSGASLEARVRTSTQVHGLTFLTAPGAVVSLDATIGGLREGPGNSGSFFFFVQDGKINGGYTGRLANPLQIVGNKP